MLVLKRKTGEAIQIGDDIELTILAIEGDQIKLGIKAPRQVDIHRKEVYLSIQEENTEASRSTGLIGQLLKQQEK
ncbi:MULTISPECIES: carbon storage regulator CsrA [Exiguobacterium]|jgi:carbon storage regulator|uniref:carbon storage regulator CsrA n=1 Tax=Exiguobacterium TaxID=33986 RepID=UPI00044AB8DA|nr:MULTISPECIES: carbon storage regulator CsrA [Exiguobacterium]EZP59535.1 Carbon storage regulator [Exiguobacterium sp. RIT341]KQS39645.1 carbon storage regulator [Exiguobacterium sp. Leaf196]MDQ6467707.1 carbon storage regulator CsrA [Exiguobacterium acetylicum]MDT0173560.1 carbon storage regulator CsrA [Exiguobacterium sp. BRG2]UKS55556.1 carbon storage regulator CsrA [Exiguobacterium acetylicum]